MAPSRSIPQSGNTPEVKPWSKLKDSPNTKRAVKSVGRSSRIRTMTCSTTAAKLTSTTSCVPFVVTRFRPETQTTLTLTNDMHTYNRSECVTFRRTRDTWGEFSNMCTGFPLEVNWDILSSSEALYQLCRFPGHPNLQREIAAQLHPMAAKKVAYNHLDKTRSDWNVVKVRVMSWVVLLKGAQHKGSFCTLLDLTGDQDIVEDVGKRDDDFWGAIPQGGPDGEVLIGHNWLGMLLMGVRRAFQAGKLRPGRLIKPSFSEAVLYGEPIKPYKIKGI